MPNDKNHIEFFNDCFDAFAHMRSIGQGLLNKSISRIYSEVSKETKSISRSNFIDTKSSLETSPRRKELFGVLSQSLSQNKAIKNSISDPIKPDLFLALTGKRLFKKDCRGSRQFLQNLLKPLHPVSQDLNLSKLTVSSPRIFIFDPVYKSPLRNQLFSFNQDQIFIIDLAQLLISCRFFSLIALFKSLKILFFPSSSKQRIVAFYLYNLFQYFSKSSPQTNAVFLTCNNLATEALRWSTIKNSSCHRVIEVLHGIPTIDIEGYFKDLLDTDTTVKEKLFFVPQIPIKFEKTIFEQQLLGPGQLSINTYFNCQFPGQKEFLKDLNLAFSDCPDEANKIILGVIGGTSHDPNFYLGKAFQIELELILIAKRYFDSCQTPYQIIYSPHPANSNEQLSEFSFFRENNIKLLNSTPQLWMLADVSFSLFSSAIFEAKYFGSFAYSPLMERDQAFSKEILNIINYPGEGISLRTSWENVLKIASQNHLDTFIGEKVISRLPVESQNCP